MATNALGTLRAIYEEATLDDLADVSEYLRDNPPVYQLVAGFVGFKPSPKESSMEEFLAAVMEVGGSVSGWGN